MGLGAVWLQINFAWMVSMGAQPSRRRRCRPGLPVARPAVLGLGISCVGAEDATILDLTAGAVERGGGLGAARGTRAAGPSVIPARTDQ